jgi:probable rRNA maturation factor
MTPSPLLIIHDCRRLPAPRTALADVVRRIYRANTLPMRQQTHLVLCSDRVIRRLNRIYRHRDRPTDVLSFTHRDNDLLGEVYISLERAAVQASEFGHPYRSELVRLLVHGMHHLLGFDHQTRADRNAMESQERRYCRP